MTANYHVKTHCILLQLYFCSKKRNSNHRSTLAVFVWRSRALPLLCHVSQSLRLNLVSKHEGSICRLQWTSWTLGNARRAVFLHLSIPLVFSDEDTCILTSSVSKFRHVLNFDHSARKQPAHLLSDFPRHSGHKESQWRQAAHYSSVLPTASSKDIRIVNACLSHPFDETSTSATPPTHSGHLLLESFWGEHCKEARSVCCARSVHLPSLPAAKVYAYCIFSFSVFHLVFELCSTAHTKPAYPLYGYLPRSATNKTGPVLPVWSYGSFVAASSKAISLVTSSDLHRLCFFLFLQLHPHTASPLASRFLATKASQQVKQISQVALFHVL